MAIVGAVTFSEFFVLTLYIQEVLGYSAIKAGVAFTAFAGTVVVISNVAQVVVGRVGVRATLATGLVLSAVSVGILSRLPEHADYVRDLLPAFILGGAGLGLSFVPLTIGSLTGVARADAGIASGLINTSRQVGGAIGIAIASAVATAAAGRVGAAASSAAALDHGFQIALVTLGGLLVAGLAVTVAFLRPAGTVAAPAEPGQAARVPAEPAVVPLERAA
jgi:fucose permease